MLLFCKDAPASPTITTEYSYVGGRHARNVQNKLLDLFDYYVDQFALS